MSTQELTLDKRVAINYKIGEFQFLAYPPDDEIQKAAFKDRVHQNGNELFYEDGFMVRYPEKYQSVVANKLNHFDISTHEFDGAFSRISIRNQILKIEGSAMYLQTLFSYESEEIIAVSNNIELIVSFLRENNIELTINDLFFASHLCNYSLAFYAFAGTPYKEIQYRDSLETILVSDKIEIKIDNKFPLENYVKNNRSENIARLHSRLTHSIDEYSNYLNLKCLGHNVTAGRDSRTSLALFAQNQKHLLKIVTDGHKYTPDKIISKLISNTFDIQSNPSNPVSSLRKFDYINVMDKKSLLELFIPMFRKIHVNNNFESDRFVASGYLGNVLTFSGTEKNIFMRDNRMDISTDFHNLLVEKFDEKIATLHGVYGDNCYAIFNIMYNTTNKVASVCRKLKYNSFCVFENDLFQLLYMLENPIDRKNSSLHYELMKISNNELLTKIPFEGNKSFYTQNDTFELQTFKESGNPRLYKKYLERHLEEILDHLYINKTFIPFCTDKFIEKQRQYIGKDLPVLSTNKLYALLGTLEFKGIRFGEQHEQESSNDEIYTTDFFQHMYVDNQVLCSGLAAMNYQSDIAFKTYINLEDSEQLRIVITEVSTNIKENLETKSCSDGFISKYTFPRNGEYIIQMSKYKKGSKKIDYFYKTKIVAKNIYSERNCDIAV